VRRVVAGTVVATIGLLVALGVKPVSTGKILAAYVLLLAAVALAALTRSAREESEWHEASLFEHALRRPVPGPVRPPQLVRLEREITLGSANGANFEQRLLPILREAAAARLAARHNVELARRPEAARRLLGDEVWELLRPDRAETADRTARGLPLRRLRRLIEALERL
jgi:hypothetical protein